MTGELRGIGDIPDAEALAALYDPSTPVALPGGDIATLHYFVSAEALACKPKDESRVTPETRLMFLARALQGGESLLPEHQYLIEPTK